MEVKVDVQNPPTAVSLNFLNGQESSVFPRCSVSKADVGFQLCIQG